MPTPEEIKKIAQAYGESMADNLDYSMSDTPDYDYKVEVISMAMAAEGVLEWLFKDYCIVPKSKVRQEYCEIKKSHKECADAALEDEEMACKYVMDVLEDIFGSSLFNEE